MTAKPVILPLAIVCVIASTPIAESSSFRHRGETALIYAYARDRQRPSRVVTMEAGEIVRAWRSAGVPVSAIAEMAKVERKTVYSWMDNGPAREHNLRRLNDLREALTGEPEDLRAIFRVWERELQDGATLRELLGASEVSKIEIRNAIRELEPSIAKHVRLGRRSTGGENPVANELREVDLGRN